MFGTKTYELTLVKGYVSHWGVVEAVRELIQNAIDSSSPFVYEFFNNGENGWSLGIHSELTTLTPTTLLLGATSKVQDNDAIGSFGEGYKIALLVLTRLGYDVDMRNDDVLWKPRFKFSKQFNEELLAIEETPLDHANNGLTFWVHGLSEEDKTAIEKSCLQMQSAESIGKVRQTLMGDILMEMPGKLYVGGIFVCDIKTTYGYNFKPAHLKLERDRQTVNSWDLKYQAKNMWFETKDYDLIADLVEKGAPELEYVQYDAPELVKEACYQLFRQRNPGKLIARSNDEMNELVKRGMTVYVGNSQFYHAVSNSRGYREENKVALSVETPSQMLEAWLRKNRGEMRANAIKAFKTDVLGAALKWVATK